VVLESVSADVILMCYKKQSDTPWRQVLKHIKVK